MTSLTFNQETAIALQSSGDAQPVDFDLAWVWLGYSTKASALRKLKNNFDKDVDYSTKWLSVAHSKGSTASRTQAIHLTIRLRVDGDDVSINHGTDYISANAGAARSHA
jgi:hypothetical protein